MLELVQKCLADEERPDGIASKAFGIIGDLADCFSDGEIKELLLSEWIASELRSKARMSADVKKNLRWARDVRSLL
jgi:importin subunit beta-1